MGTRTRTSNFRRGAVLVCALLAVTSQAAPAIAKRHGDGLPGGEGGSFDSLVLRNLEGEKVSLASLHGKVVLLNFWATWCQPCMEEMPVLSDLAERYGRRGFVVVAASVDDSSSRSDVARVAAALPDTMKVWIGATLEDMQRLELGASVPVSVLLDRDGGVAERHRGSLPHGLIDGKIESLLAGGGGKDRNDDMHRKPFDATEASNAHQSHSRPNTVDQAAARSL